MISATLNVQGDHLTESRQAKAYRTLVNRNVAQILAAFGEVRRRIYAREGMKLFDEVRLIVITALMSDRRPLNLLCSLDRLQNLLKLCHTCEALGTQANDLFKLRDQVFLSDPDVTCEIFDGEELW